ncbi:hypothetical protein ACHAW5_011285 [Stephanodiscus triporus]|uniref:Ubiquitin-like domain-containing protein n=1 Tax=Stephanodiscus triporus TaxID=2934178 RepID=A0ABD3Q7Z6_9STRA
MNRLGLSSSSATAPRSRANVITPPALSNNRAPLAGSVDNAGDDSAITIRVKDQTGEETMYKIKKSTTFDKIMHAYAMRKGVEAKSLRFYLDGEHIGPNNTCAELELEDEDQVDVILAQVGC